LSDKIITFGNLNVDECYELFESKVCGAFNRICPLVEVKEKEIKLSWSLEIVELKRRRKNLFISYKRTRNFNLIKKCREIDKKIRSLLIKDRKKRFEKHLGNFSDNGALWKGVKSILNQAIVDIPDTLKVNNETLETNESIADGFATYFDQKTKNIINECSMSDDVYNGESILNIFNENFMTAENLNVVYKSLKRKKSHGFDLIPMLVIVDLFPVLGELILDLLNRIYDTRVIPVQWKIYIRGVTNIALKLQTHF